MARRWELAWEMPNGMTLQVHAITNEHVVFAKLSGDCVVDYVVSSGDFSEIIDALDADDAYHPLGLRLVTHNGGQE